MQPCVAQLSVAPPSSCACVRVNLRLQFVNYCATLYKKTGILMNTNAKKLFGARLKEARVAAGLHQEDMAEALMVSRQAISKWERGDSAPTALQLGELATMCCVCAHTLLFGAPYRDPVVGKLIAGWLKLAASQGAEDGSERAD